MPAEFLFAEVVRLCVRLAAGRVKCSARFNSCDSMWRYPWTGKNQVHRKPYGKGPVGKQQEFASDLFGS